MRKHKKEYDEETAINETIVIFIITTYYYVRLLKYDYTTNVKHAYHDEFVETSTNS